jgi:hypothetical protein
VRGDGGDIGDLLGGPELRDADVGQADVADDALLAQFRERADLVLEGDVVGGMRADLERLDLLYTSLLLQQASGLQQARVPGWA